jgi:hypothetical protein
MCVISRRLARRLDFVVVPAKAGTQGQTLNRQFVTEVAPLRIMALDQLKFPGTPPFFYPLFAQDRIGHGLVKFGEDQVVDAVVSHKAGNRIRPMLPNAASEIGRYTDIERTVASAGKNVHTRTFLRHPMTSAALGPRFRGDDKYYIRRRRLTRPAPSL